MRTPRLPFYRHLPLDEAPEAATQNLDATENKAVILKRTQYQGLNNPTGLCHFCERLPFEKLQLPLASEVGKFDFNIDQDALQHSHYGRNEAALWTPQPIIINEDNEVEKQVEPSRFSTGELEEVRVLLPLSTTRTFPWMLKSYSEVGFAWVNRQEYTRIPMGVGFANG